LRLFLRDHLRGSAQVGHAQAQVVGIDPLAGGVVQVARGADHGPRYGQAGGRLQPLPRGGIGVEATSSVPVSTWKCVTAPWVSTTIVVPRTAATAFGVRTRTVSPGRSRGRATLNAMPPALRSTTAWV